MATPRRPPRSDHRSSALRQEIADAITEKVTAKVNEKVARQVDKVADKVARKVDTASEKANAKLDQDRRRLDRERDRLDRHEHLHGEALQRLASHLEALEVWTRGAGAGRRPRFRREEIAAAAVRLADTEGFESLSMRRLAAELGAGTMTLYHYVRTKDELLTLVNDAVMAEVVVPDDEPLPDDWRAAITLIAERTRACLERHPWILDITDDPSIGPNQVKHFEQSMQAVSALDLPLWERLDVITAIDEYVFGYCAHARSNLHPDHQDDGSYSEGLVDYIAGLLATGDYPHLVELTAEASIAEVMQIADEHSRDPGRFRRNLDRLLDGIEADLARRDRPTG